MAFFKRELSPVERFEAALKTKQAERAKLADRLSLAESVLGEKRAAAERLAVAGASNAKLERADAKLRTVEDRAKTLRAALAELDAQIASNEHALSEARAQREREMRADQIERLAAVIEQALPGFAGGAAALVDAVTRSAVTVAEASGFSASVDAVRREVLSAADLVCWELRALAVRTRAGNDLHAECAVVARGQRRAQGAGLCAGRIAQGLAAGRVAPSACRASQRPPRADLDACPWQRRD